MKVILTILCVGMILFGGGCAIALGVFSGPGFSSGNNLAILGLIPIGIVVLNIIVLAVLYGSQTTLKFPLYFLAVLDFLLAAAILLSSFSVGTGTGSLFGIVFLMALVFMVKGYLTWLVARK